MAGAAIPEAIKGMTGDDPTERASAKPANPPKPNHEAKGTCGVSPKRFTKRTGPGHRKTSAAHTPRGSKN